MKFSKYLVVGFVALAFLSLSFTKIGGEIETIKVGAAMPGADVKLVSTNEDRVTLADLYGENGLLVVFSCNSCPFVVGGKDIEGWEGRYNEVFDAAEKNKVKMVLVNSNAARRDRGESIKDMKKRAQEKGIKAMYVLDKGSALADDFGARTTPHVFLFNSAKKLVYAGAIDDNCNDSKQVKEKWLENALNKLNAGEKIDPNQTRQKGCSIKRVAK
ncbi:MAG TPA: thioredoxin family protein [Flavobacteriales bacterium]|nr:thioredoxin family protein [Crocinitomicaceae bacterium]HAE29470.1 thioredoxin family protein [Flavobacteriales bacterium]|tara:strand:+ start:216 stop:860 length:645 start_codon:yes stop_codon:yes gene_type:complete